MASAASVLRASPKPDKLYNHYVVGFVQRGRKPHTRLVDVVNGLWLVIDTNRKVKTRYPQDPINDKSYQALLKSVSPANEQWPFYTVKLRARSDDLGEALEKLDKLKTSISALTATSNDDCEMVEQREIESIRRHNLMEGAATYMKNVSSISRGAKHITEGFSDGLSIAPTSKHAVMVPQSVNKKTATECGLAGNTDSSNLHEHVELRGRHQSPASKDSIVSITSSSSKSNSSSQRSSSQTSLSRPSNRTVSPLATTSSQSSFTRNKLQNGNILMRSSDHDEKPKSHKRSSATDTDSSLSSNPHKKLRKEYSSDVVKQLSMVNDSLVVLAKKVQENSDELATVKAMLIKMSDNVSEDFVGNMHALAQKYQSSGDQDEGGFEIPITSQKNFDNFETALKKGGDIVADLKDVLKCKLTKCMTISKCLVGMFKMILTRDMARTFTATKEVKGKNVMYHTTFYSICEEVIKERRALANMENFDDHYRKKLSEVLTNVQKWKEESSPAIASISGHSENKNGPKKRTPKMNKNSVQYENSSNDDTIHEDFLNFGPQVVEIDLQTTLKPDDFNDYSNPGENRSLTLKDLSECTSDSHQGEDPLRHSDTEGDEDIELPLIPVVQCPTDDEASL
ncbi:hypothetical protein QAD02_009001 [Eretmocerus hayati]|uniref:Uncharacterized protein n=1 Tax=Eretmocerus hayati TaxID=131215 RepID=A0ACC2NAI1_9HYME|nr:hypothetical protein QAD02_009001 [Eretmocerus hayati]